MNCSPTALRTLGVALLLSLLTAGTACGGGAGEGGGTGQGKVVAVDVAKGEITLDHGEIPGVMGPMQMAFPVAEPKLLDGVSAGQSVEFDLEYRGGMYTVKAIRPRAQ